MTGFMRFVSGSVFQSKSASLKGGLPASTLGVASTRADENSVGRAMRDLSLRTTVAGREW